MTPIIGEETSQLNEEAPLRPKFLERLKKDAEVSVGQLQFSNKRILQPKKMDDLSELEKVASKKLSSPEEKHPFDESISSKESFYSNQSFSQDSEEKKKELLSYP